MFSIEAHGIYHPTINDDTGNGDWIPLPSNSTKYALISLVLTLNFIESWIKSFKDNYLHRTTIYCEEIHDLFKNIIVAIPEPKPDDWKNKI